MNFFPHWGNYQKSSIQKISKEAGLREKKSFFGKIMKTEDQSNSFLPLKPIINQKDQTVRRRVAAFFAGLVFCQFHLSDWEEINKLVVCTLAMAHPSF